MHLTEGLLKDILPEAVVLHGTLDCEVLFSVDSRSILEHELFVPVHGAQVDGHSFLEHALRAGAGALVAWDKKNLVETLPKDLLAKRLIILVDNHYVCGLFCVS